MLTTCPHCHTCFRVGTTVLRQKQGMVRCGVCSAPFQAMDSLADEPVISPTAPLPANISSAEHSAQGELFTEVEEKKTTVPKMAERPSNNLSLKKNASSPSPQALQGLNKKNKLAELIPISLPQKLTGVGATLMTMVFSVLVCTLLVQGLMVVYFRPSWLPAPLQHLYPISKIACSWMGCKTPIDPNHPKQVVKLEYYDLLPVPQYAMVKVLSFTLTNPHDQAVPLPVLTVSLFAENGTVSRQKMLSPSDYVYQGGNTSPANPSSSPSEGGTPSSLPMLSPQEKRDYFVWLKLEENDREGKPYEAVKSFEVKIVSEH